VILTRGVQWLVAAALGAAACAVGNAQDAQAQIRGVYPVGMKCDELRRDCFAHLGRPSRKSIQAAWVTSVASLLSSRLESLA
jgi:hypothetical protein